MHFLAFKPRGQMGMEIVVPLVSRFRQVAAACLAVGCIVTTALAATPFDGLVGAWSGSGQIRYEDGQSEGVRCSAYYSESNQRLRLAIRCKSASNEIEIRGQLAQRADKITGTWEERTFNVSGDATGHMTPGRMSLSITGGAFSGAMSVAYAGSKQAVSISIQGISMKSVSITLVRG
jgi:hypothetical protein